MIDTSKFLLPWQKRPPMVFAGMERKDLFNKVIATVYFTVGGGVDYIIADQYTPGNERYSLMEEAIQACDTKLVALGYEFISEERAEKLRLLL